MLGHRGNCWARRAVFIGGLVVLAGGAAACSGDDDLSNPPTSGTTQPANGGDAGDLGQVVAGADDSLTGIWEGTYTCAQGEAELILAVDDRGDGQIGANFAYHPADTNPGTATGRYSMEGTLADNQLSLDGYRWIDQGGASEMVGLRAAVAAGENPTQLDGTVQGTGCTTFTVQRTSTDAWYIGTFSGKYGCNQGMTGITLTTKDEGDGKVTATYEFYEVPENPGVPSGKFAMTGTYTDGELNLSGSEWIDQPTGYVMVDLKFRSEEGVDPQRLFGEVVGGGCSLFNLFRDQAGAAGAGA